MDMKTSEEEKGLLQRGQNELVNSI